MGGGCRLAGGGQTVGHGSGLSFSMDVLLKVNGVREEHNCGSNAIRDKKAEVYEGILIKESIEDENIIDLLNIHRVELWNTGGKPKYWTVRHFSCAEKDFPEQISKIMISDPNSGGNWFVDFKGELRSILYFEIRC